MAIDGSSCGLCLDRREFLASCATCAAGMAGAWALGAKSLLAAEAVDGGVKPKIRLVFSHHRQDEQGKQSEPGWPYLGYDHEGRKKELTEKLRQCCPGTEFLPATAYSVADAEKLLQADNEVDGYLAYMIGGWALAAETIAGSGRPTIFAGDLFGASGEILVSYAAARRKGLKVISVSSSRFDDVVQAVKCFECMKKLRRSTILLVGRPPAEDSKAIEKEFGAKVLPISFEQINQAYGKADPTEVQKWADCWISGAEKVVEPSRADIEKSAALYLAMCELMHQHNAQAITVNCLGGVYGGRMGAYPCLGFRQLNDDGRVGGCEADLQSTITMLLMSYLVGRPGYISDPVIDTATNRVIYLHCVAPTKVFGPEGESNPYHIRSHAEDRKGAAIRSLMPLGHLTTTLKFSPTTRQVILHQAKTVTNVDDDKSCRTKLAAEVQGDIDKLWTEWDRWGWHRVTFYGDHKRAVEQVSALLGFRVVEEA